MLPRDEDWSWHDARPYHERIISWLLRNPGRACLIYVALILLVALSA